MRKAPTQWGFEALDKQSSGVVIESRLHLLSALAEAAESEHSLMCLYLYAMFSLKRVESEGVSAKELAAIDGWRKAILHICLEEMSHLSLVSNIISAIGGTPNFMRPNFPVAPGYFPSGMVMELAPFDLNTLEHFIYLERPASFEVEDSHSFRPETPYERYAPEGRILPSSGDYKTIGILYGAIQNALSRLSEEIGESKFFCGNTNRQITAADSALPGLIAVKNLDTALKAVHTIIVQGEGALSVHNSHFERFTQIKDQYLDLLRANPAFEPGRKVARNPVMRKPINPKNHVWVDHPLTSRYLDLANGFYAFMVRVLVQIYLIEDRDRKEKSQLLQLSFSIMHTMATVGEALTLLPASENTPGCFAGMSFAMVRTLSPLAKENELDLMTEVLKVASFRLKNLQGEIEKLKSTNSPIEPCTERLAIAQKDMVKWMNSLTQLQLARSNVSRPTALDPALADAPEGSGDCETAASSLIAVSFRAKKCIHKRHCVTELPLVFKANTPGKWLFPEAAPAETIAAVVRECPSGALTYESKGQIQNETPPQVNTMRLYENGPYAFLADLVIDGKKEGCRATLCRCGNSNNKPFCDHSHIDAGFLATGEPETIDSRALDSREGPLVIERTDNGPLSVKGNLELCAGTGRVVLRTTNVLLCRCGHSKSKPVCDGTHATIGFQDHITRS